VFVISFFSKTVANRPSRGLKSRSRKKRPQSGRRLKAPRAATIQAAAARSGGHRWKDSLKKTNFFRSAPMQNRKYGAASARARLQEQLQERVNYTSGRGLVATGNKKLDLSKLLGIGQ
jgi:hypothetical protein